MQFLPGKVNAMESYRLLIIAAGVLTSLVTSRVPAQPVEAEFETPEQRAERMQWWQEARFGMFIHWGPVSLKGTEIGWSRRSNWPGERVPAEVYDSLYKQFNPVKFDADEWVRIAQAAGMKYLVFTTKHHDGFCNFDTKLTDYKITSPESPFGRDIVAELAQACHKAGMPLGFYYSQPDWYRDDFRTDRHAEYIEYLHGQVRELCTNYGKVSIIWFDGLGGTAEDWDSHRLLRMIRELQPGVIINNRAGLPADHDTPEQRIGAFQNHRPWETCMTICQQWAWKPDDKLKSLEECIQTLVRTAGGDGNLLFNVGPMPDGRIEPRQVERLREMGEWLGKYGESIYGTRGGPFKYCAYGDGVYTSTHRANRVFLHVLAWPEDETPIKLPPIGKKIRRTLVLTGGQADVRQQEDGITVFVPPSYRNEIDTIVMMELDGSAADIQPVSGRSNSLAAGRPARASNVYRGMPEFVAEQALDGDMETRWATDAGRRSAWLEVDLGSPQVFGEAFISEAMGERIKRFELQREAGGEWVTFFEGTRVGPEARFTFEPVTARRVRLDILEASEGPTLFEFQLYPPSAPKDRP